MAHRESIKEYLAKIKLQNCRAIDWGCGTKPARNYVGNKNVKWVLIDKLDHVNADIVSDMQKEDIKTTFTTEDKFDIAFCMEVLEHAEFPENILKNIWYSLKEKGTLILSVPFLYPVHHTEDYWRWTNTGIALILKREGFDVDEVLPTENNMGWIVKATKRI